MKAFVPGPDGGVVLAEVAEPVQRPGEALVKVAAYSVNRGEHLQLAGRLGRPGGDWRPGKDVAGLVVQAAPDGSGPPIGRRVVGHPPAGGWAEYVTVPTDALAELPEEVGWAQAAALPLAGLTALRLLRTVGHPAGLRLLLTGASGGVGHYLTELAAAAGASVTAVTRTEERGAELVAAGAAAVVRDVADAEGPFDVVLESTGGRALPAALARLAPHGRLIWFGQASGEPVTLDFFDFFAGPVGASVSHFSYAADDRPYGPDLRTLARLTAEGRLRPRIGRLADWHDTATVLTDLGARRIRGKAVLTVG